MPESDLARSTTATARDYQTGSPTLALPSDRGEPLAPNPATPRQSRPTALGGLAGQKAVLPLPANLRWLVLTFHANSFAVPFPWPQRASRCHRSLHGVFPFQGSARIPANRVASSA